MSLTWRSGPICGLYYIIYDPSSTWWSNRLDATKFLDNNVDVLLYFIWYYMYMLLLIEDILVQVLTRYWENIEIIYAPTKILHILQLYKIKKLNYISNLITVKYPLLNYYLRITLSTGWRCCQHNQTRNNVYRVIVMVISAPYNIYYFWE